MLLLPSRGHGVAPEEAGKGLPRSKTIILLVDDEDVVRRVTAAVLRRLGYEVVEAPDGETALEVLAGAEARIDLLLTDLSMRGTTGLEVAAAFRAQHPGRPVVYTSGYSDEMLLQRVYEEGGTFLPKPYDMRDLERTLRETLTG